MKIDNKIYNIAQDNYLFLLEYGMFFGYYNEVYSSLEYCSSIPFNETLDYKYIKDVIMPILNNKTDDYYEKGIQTIYMSTSINERLRWLKTIINSMESCFKDFKKRNCLKIETEKYEEYNILYFKKLHNEVIKYCYNKKLINEKEIKKLLFNNTEPITLPKTYYEKIDIIINLKNEQHSLLFKRSI